MSGKATGWLRVEDGVYDITALTLYKMISCCCCTTGIINSTHPSKNLNRAEAGLLLAIVEIAGVELVFILLSNTPKMSAGAHGHVDDAASPNIDAAWVKFVIDILFRSDVWCRST